MIIFAKNPEIITIDAKNIVVERKKWEYSSCMNNLQMKEDGNYYRYLDSEKSVTRKEKIKELEKAKTTAVVVQRKEVQQMSIFPEKAKKRNADVEHIKSKIIIVSPVDRIKYNVLNDAFYCKSNPTINDHVMVFKNAKVIDDFPIPNDYITKGTVFSRIIVDKERRLLKAWYKNYNKVTPDVILTQISE
jgi:hypothetical protein